jgi:diacylglycerol O-acyltransferase
MPHAHENDSLSWGDALFLYLERQGMPLNVASVSVFEGHIPLDDCIEFIESKLPLIPRYRQRVVAPAFNFGLPSWEYDRKFDLRNHVRQVTLKRDTDAEFKAAAGKILSSTMDRERPLWDLTLLQAPAGHRTGLMFRMHHCLADGIAGVGLMNVIMDASPTRQPIPPRKTRIRVPRQDPGSRLLDWSVNSYFSTVQGLLRMQSEVVELVHKIVTEGSSWSVSEFEHLLPELAAPTEPLPFNLTCSGPQKVAWADVPVEQIKAVKNALGVTFNDVVLGIVTSVVKRYVEMRGVHTRGRLLRIMVPVNVRHNGDHHLGNRISLVPVTIPLDIRSPRKLIAAIHERTSFLKHAHVAELVGLAGTLIGTIPTAVQALAGPIASQLPITPFNLVCTNVPGPEAPLYLLGHKMLRWYPYVPIGGQMAVNCAILTYDGTAYFGFSGNVQAAPDLRRLEKFFTIALAEMQKVSGIIAKPPKPQRPKARVVPKKAARLAVESTVPTPAAAPKPPAPIRQQPPVAVAS